MKEIAAMPSDSPPNTSTVSSPSQTDTDTDRQTFFDERSIGALIVDALTLPFGAVGAGLLSLVSNADPTKRSWRTALGWRHAAVTVGVALSGFLLLYAELTGRGITDIGVLPSPIASVVYLLVPTMLFVMLLAVGVVLVTGILVVLRMTVGTVQRALTSSAAADWLGPYVAILRDWPGQVLLYMMTAPLVSGVLVVGPRDGFRFFLIVVGIVGIILLLVPIATVAMYIHAGQRRLWADRWQPSMGAYLGGPLVGAVGGYALSETAVSAINPLGGGLFVFLGALWAAAAVYLLRWRAVSNQ